MLCAHDHYEDCPWREQALYGMDSRNQMLFGYGAFGEYELPRASLRLFADSLEKDGLIPLCAPARGRITIPSFSVYWLLAVCENAEADFDGEFVREMLPKAEKMLEIFRARSSGRGVSLFREPRYWNFHEWCEGLDGGNFNRTEDIPEEKDGILTALVRLASAKLSALERRLGRAEKAEDLRAFSESLRDGLEYFYDPDAGLYASYADEGGNRLGYHAYMQAAALSAADNMPEARKKSLCAALKAPEGKMTKMTLAALPMLYDAVMATDGDIGWCVETSAPFSGKCSFPEPRPIGKRRTERPISTMREASAMVGRRSAVTYSTNTWVAENKEREDAEIFWIFFGRRSDSAGRTRFSSAGMRTEKRRVRSKEGATAKA